MSTEKSHRDETRIRSSSFHLQELGFDVDASGLGQALKANDISVRAEAAFLAGAKNLTSMMDLLRQSTHDTEARVRVEAASALAQLGAVEEAIPLLLEELKGDFFEAAPLRAARALADLGEPAGYLRTIEALASEFPSNRMEAIAVLPVFLKFSGQELKGFPIDPIAALAESVEDPEPILRRDALSVLASLDDPRAQKALVTALSDPEETIQQFVKELLEK